MWNWAFCLSWQDGHCKAAFNGRSTFHNSRFLVLFHAYKKVTKCSFCHSCDMNPYFLSFKTKIQTDNCLLHDRHIRRGLEKFLLTLLQEFSHKHIRSNHELAVWKSTFLTAFLTHDFPFFHTHQFGQHTTFLLVVWKPVLPKMSYWFPAVFSRYLSFEFRCRDSFCSKMGQFLQFWPFLEEMLSGKL